MIAIKRRGGLAIRAHDIRGGNHASDLHIACASNLHISGSTRIAGHADTTGDYASNLHDEHASNLHNGHASNLHSSHTSDCWGGSHASNLHMPRFFRKSGALGTYGRIYASNLHAPHAGNGLGRSHACNLHNAGASSLHGFRRTSKAAGSGAAGAKDETLRRLRALLDAEEPQAIEWLVGMWEGQRAAATYAELRAFAVPGAIGDELLERWQADYDELVGSRLAPQWERAIEAATADRAARFRFAYGPSPEMARRYSSERGARIVAALAEEQRNAVRAMVSHASGFAGMDPERLSRIMRPAIGLTAPQAKANLNYWATVWENGVESGMSEAAAGERADRMAATYAGRQHRHRAMSIARTELAMAYNEGAYGATRDAFERGYIGDCKKTWLTAADERMCPTCGALDGESANMDAAFSNGSLMPPAHPNCRCAVEYTEVAPPVVPALPMPEAPDAPETGGEGQGGDETDAGTGGAPAETDATSFEWLDGLDEDQKIKFLGGKTKAALYDAGMLSRADFFKPLKDIDLKGIIIPDSKAMTHSMLGEYIAPSKDYPNGRLKNGAHTELGMLEMNKREIKFVKERIVPNGVLFGHVPDHKEKFKQRSEKQTWFPKTWTEHDIRAAGIKAMNKGTAIDYTRREAVHKGVNVRVLIADGRIKTICPSYDQPK